MAHIYTVQYAIVLELVARSLSVNSMGKIAVGMKMSGLGSIRTIFCDLVGTRVPVFRVLYLLYFSL